MNAYDALDSHRSMVGDRIRTEAFRRAIHATVQPGMTVLDVGAGSGILSVFAAQAGARRVYAVERAAGAAAIAREMIARNRCADIVQVFESDLARASLPGKVDVIVSEWLGAYGVDENMLAPVLVARDRWLIDGGAMIPSTCTAWCVPIEHDAAAATNQFRDLPYGADCSALAVHSADQAVWVPWAPVSAMRAQPLALWVTDCATMPAADAHTPYAAQRRFTLTGAANALAVWFSAELPGTTALSNGPGDPATHWGLLLFPIVAAAQCRAGDELDIGFHNVPVTNGSHHIWAARVGDGVQEVHDTRRHPRANIDPPWRVHTPTTEGALHV